MIAAYFGFEESLDVLIQFKADVAATDLEGQTALHVAIHRAQLGCAKKLVQAGADFNVTDKQGRNLIMSAIFSNNPITIDYCLSLGLSLSTPDKDGFTPLQYAIHHELPTMLSHLLGRFSEPELTNLARDTNDTSLLSSCVRARNPALLSVLNKHDILDRIDTQTCADTLSFLLEGDVKIEHIQALLSSQTTRRRLLNTLMPIIQEALQNEDTNTLRALLESCNNIDQYAPGEQSLLQYASTQGTLTGLAPLLLELGSIPTSHIDPEHDLLTVAVSQCKLPVVAAIAEHLNSTGVVVNDQAIIKAVEIGETEHVQILLRSGANIHARTSTGQSLLHVAAIHGHIAITGILLTRIKYDADFDDEGLTPLLYAALHGNHRVVKLLIEYGHSIYDIASSGLTSLHAAVYSRDHRTLDLLLLNADQSTSTHFTESNDQYGWNALHIACRIGSIPAVRRLARYRSLLNSKTKCSLNMTPLQIAAESGKSHALMSLIDYEANVSLYSSAKPIALKLASKNAMYECAVLLYLYLIGRKQSVDLTTHDAEQFRRFHTIRSSTGWQPHYSEIIWAHLLAKKNLIEIDDYFSTEKYDFGHCHAQLQCFVNLAVGVTRPWIMPTLTKGQWNAESIETAHSVIVEALTDNEMLNFLESNIDAARYLNTNCFYDNSRLWEFRFYHEDANQVESLYFLQYRENNYIYITEPFSSIEGLHHRLVHEEWVRLELALTSSEHGNLIILDQIDLVPYTNNLAPDDLAMLNRRIRPLRFYPKDSSKQEPLAATVYATIYDFREISDNVYAVGEDGSLKLISRQHIERLELPYSLRFTHYRALSFIQETVSA